MQARLFHLHALSALHCGTGQSADVVDLPIARARATKLPIVPGSSLRGMLRREIMNRAMSNESDGKDEEALFGRRTISGDADTSAGRLSIGDAHLLLLPVRCLAGIVSYVTCPFILRRYARDRERSEVGVPTVPSPADEMAAIVTSTSVNCVGDKLVLEDLDLRVRREDGSLLEWARAIAGTVHPGDTDAQQDVVVRFAVVPDDVMSFLSDTATEVRARIRIDPKTGTVSKGALWYEEYLPAESVLWGVFAVSTSNRPDDARTADQLARAMPSADTVQLGGNAGVGSGMARFLTTGAPA